MRKISTKERERDVASGLRHRSGPLKRSKRRNSNSFRGCDVNAWIDKHKENGIILDQQGSRIVLHLPERLNFETDLDLTNLTFNAIRQLSKNNRSVSHSAYRLRSVNFDSLRSISTSAALVLTSEISKWDDITRNKLKPQVAGWDSEILHMFNSLGYFDLFKNKPSNLMDILDGGTSKSEVRTLRYIKGRCGDDIKTKQLKDGISQMIGQTIDKWPFLHSGLSEAIVNVTHHAYPKEYSVSASEKNWYITASYDRDSRDLNVVFYDQGIGIPKTLPSSSLWEMMLKGLSLLPEVARMEHEVLLKAAVELDRTRTNDSDRGKGLQDLLEFVRQRQNGSLAILSLCGLFEMIIKDGKEITKTNRARYPVNGTLIIWSVKV